MDKYTVQEVDSKNIILMGRTTSGKSTVLRVIKDSKYVPPPKKIVADTRDTSVNTIQLTDFNNKSYIMSVVDTPGLFEKRLVKSEERDNTVILSLAKKCLVREMTKIHALCIVVNLEAGFNTDDVETIRALITLFGKEASKIALLVCTHSELKDDATLQQLKAEFMGRHDLKDISSFFGMGITFVGSLHPDHASLYKQVPELHKSTLERVIKMKNQFLETIINSKEVFEVKGMKSVIDDFNKQVDGIVQQKLDQEKVKPHSGGCRIN